MGKPYKAVDELVAQLWNRGLDIPDWDDAAETLMSIGYYPLVNGYKDMLLDVEASRRAGEDRYAEGSSFAQLKVVYALDRGFRIATIDATMRAESVMKTALVDAFCSEYGGGDSYMGDGWDCGEDFYRGSKEDYASNLSRLRHTLGKLRENKRHKDYVQHYIDEYGNVPLWVLAPCLTFGDIAMLYDFQNDKVQNKACDNIAMASGKGQVSPRKLREAFQVLTPFRNICAHNERVFCGRVGPRGQYRMRDIFPALGIVLPDRSVSRYAKSVRYYLNVVDDEEFAAKVLGEMKMTRESLDGYVVGE